MTKDKESVGKVKNADTKRFFPNINTGLSTEQVRQREAEGLLNYDNSVKTKTEKQIIFENTFTFFNTINIILAIFVLLVGSYRNLMFMGVIISNAAIGSLQGIRSKRAIDKLSLISAPKAHVVRDGKKIEIAVDKIVLDDILHLETGNQICADCILLEGEVEVNESLLTGESDTITKKAGDMLLSGSFIVSGSCHSRVENIGEENYATKIASQAKYVKEQNSAIMKSLNMIVKFIGFSIIPVGIILFTKQYFLLSDTLEHSVVSTVAALIGMIPEGLVLLTSVVFAVTVIRLATHKTLVKELYSSETLARVDVLCLDKTGTITEGSMQVDLVLPISGIRQEEIEDACLKLSSVLSDNNPTFEAVREKFPVDSGIKASHIIAFSSQRKWSGAYLKNDGAYIMGAGEFVFGEEFKNYEKTVKDYSEKGQRVLVVAKSSEDFNDKELPKDIKLMGFIVLSDKIRAEAKQTLRYFSDQGVDLKIISGDNAVTVSNIAKKAGLETAEEYIDASTLSEDCNYEEVVEKYSVFGRVTPHQKLEFVKALKKCGHTVAMTGDGVNDVLALKEADCSIAMASGSDAARTVSDLVLLDSNFASMPVVVREGRRSINNLQRSATLFLAKTIYSVLMALLFVFSTVPYPFQPIHLTLISTLTIGVPSFLLALEPNKARVKGNFLINVLNKSLPAGLTTVLNICFLLMVKNNLNLSNEQFSTLCVVATTITAMVLLVRACFPFSIMRSALVLLLCTGFIVAVIYFSELFVLAPINTTMIIILIPIIIFASLSVTALTHFIENYLKVKSEKS